ELPALALSWCRYADRWSHGITEESDASVGSIILTETIGDQPALRKGCTTHGDTKNTAHGTFAAITGQQVGTGNLPQLATGGTYAGQYTPLRLCESFECMSEASLDTWKTLQSSQQCCL